MRYKFPQFKIHELGSAWGAFAQCDLTGRRAPGSRRDSIVHTLLLLDDQCRNRDVIRKHPDTSLNEAEPYRKRKSVHAQCFSAGAILSLLEMFGVIWRCLWSSQLGRCWQVCGSHRGHATLTCRGWLFHGQWSGPKWHSAETVSPYGVQASLKLTIFPSWSSHLFLQSSWDYSYVPPLPA
jgi:hypothetical protein